MLANQEELLDLVRKLREACWQRTGTARAFDDAAALLRAIGAKCTSPGVLSLGREVESKADQLYRRPPLQSEDVIHDMLLERINRLEAVIRAGGDRRSPVQPPWSPLIPSRRWDDRLLPASS